MTFNVGDKIRCINAEGDQNVLVFDAIYTIKDIPAPNMLILEEDDGWTWGQFRFKKEIDWFQLNRSVI